MLQWLRLMLVVLPIVFLSCVIPPIFAPDGSPTPVPTQESPVKFINHPKPDFSVDAAPFQDVGCPRDEKYPNSSYARCTPESPMAMLGCTHLWDADLLFGGLKPLYPMVTCIVYSKPGDQSSKLKEGEYLWWDGGPVPIYRRLVIYKDNEFVLIKNLADLQAAFAPIETPEEALSFAMIATGMEGYYDQTYIGGYRYRTDTVEDTHVVQVDNNYEVNLYDYQWIGCGPHTYNMFKILVTTDGQITIGKRIPMYEDPKLDGLCQD